MRSSITPLVLLLSCCCSGSALRASLGPDGKYTVLHGSEALFTGAPVAVFCDGAWHTQASKTLTLTASRAIEGMHPALGMFTGTELSWEAGAGATPVLTAALTALDESSVVFRLAFPNGANGTAHELPANDVVANFPAFTSVAPAIQTVLSWESSFMGGASKTQSVAESTCCYAVCCCAVCCCVVCCCYVVCYCAVCCTHGSGNEPCLT